MPSARPDYEHHLPVLSERSKPRFSDEQLRGLRAICSSPEFERDVVGMAWIYRAYRKAGAPTDAAVVATLRDLNRRAYEMHELLDGLSPQIKQLLDDESAARKHGGDLPKPLVKHVWERIGWLSTCAYFAARSAQVRRGRPSATIERIAATEVRQLFAKYGVPFRKKHASYVLCLALGLDEGQRVERHFAIARTARKK